MQGTLLYDCLGVENHVFVDEWSICFYKSCMFVVHRTYQLRSCYWLIIPQGPNVTNIHKVRWQYIMITLKSSTSHYVLIFSNFCFWLLLWIRFHVNAIENARWKRPKRPNSRFPSPRSSGEHINKLAAYFCMVIEWAWCLWKEFAKHYETEYVFMEETTSMFWGRYCQPLFFAQC